MSRRSHGWSGRTVTDARRYWAFRIHEAAKAGTPLACYRCALPVLPTQDWDVDHLIGRDAGGAVRDRNNQWPSHSACNRAQGAAITNAAKSRERQGLWSW